MINTYNEYVSKLIHSVTQKFFDECGVYQLHRSVIKSYFETGICKRADEVPVSEYQYEGHMMQENIGNMLKYISLKQKLVFVFNRLNNANESTLRILLDNALKYGYYNHLAHIYVFAFDNKAEQFSEIKKLEENLPYFYKGINLAKRLGNERLLVEGYKKNIMIASTKGFFDISNYYYELLTEVELIKKNDFEIANIYNGLGYNNCAAENHTKSNEYYNKALIIFDKIKEPEYVGETLYNMALNAMLANEYKVASEYLEKCKQFCRENGYAFKEEIISMYCDEKEIRPKRWNLSLEGITLMQIESNVKSLAVQDSYIRQKHNMDFLSI